jgi:hypothetical protein
MAETKKGGSKGGLTRGKAILIASLAVVLLGVLYVQFGSGGDSAASSEPFGYKPRQVVAASIASIASPAAAAVNKKLAAESSLPTGVTSVVDESRWKSPNLKEVVNYDPFALPSSFPKQEELEASPVSGDGVVAEAAADDAKKLADAIDRLERQLAELKEQGVQVVVRERDQYVAMVGDRTVHVGDEINGFIVTDIDPTYGVRVERKGTQ